MYPSLTERLREFYVENGRLSLELISDFLQLHRRHNKDTGGKWEKITIATGTNIAVEAKIDIEEKIVINVLEIQTRMTWQCLISLLRICQVDTLYLHLDVYHGSFEQRDISVDMPNTKVVSSVVISYIASFSESVQFIYNTTWHTWTWVFFSIHV